MSVWLTLCIQQDHVKWFDPTLHSLVAYIAKRNYVQSVKDTEKLGFLHIPRAEIPYLEDLSAVDILIR